MTDRGGVFLSNGAEDLNLPFLTGLYCFSSHLFGNLFISAGLFSASQFRFTLRRKGWEELQPKEQAGVCLTFESFFQQDSWISNNARAICGVLKMTCKCLGYKSVKCVYYKYKCLQYSPVTYSVSPTAVQNHEFSFKSCPCFAQHATAPAAPEGHPALVPL